MVARVETDTGGEDSPELRTATHAAESKDGKYTESALIAELRSRAEQLTAEPWYKDLLVTEGVDEEQAAKELESFLTALRPGSDLLRIAQDVKDRRASTNEYNRIPWLAWVGVVAGPLAISGLLAIFFGWSVWFGVAALGMLIWVPDALRDRRRKQAGIENAPAELSKATTDLDRRMRSLISACVRVATKPRFAQFVDDVVAIGEAPNLSSRVLPEQRIETRSRAPIEMHLSRAGGATVGVRGERGTGKSEILRSFCEDPLSRASLDDGGTIGVFISVPAAYESLPFLRLLTQRLIENVPGYLSPLAIRRRRRRRLGPLLAVLGYALLMTGLLGVDGLVGVRPTEDLINWILAGAGLVALVSGGYMVMLGSFTGASSTGDNRNRALLKRDRRSVARDAAELMTRLRFSETLKTQREGSFEWRKVGAKSSKERSLSQIPMTEPDVLSEFSALAEQLGKVGYRIVVGIDEMDKLEAGPDTEKFLNSVKQLFSVRSCSFLVSVSTSAWTRFVRRGVDVRDALDSSLDAIELVDPLDFFEARSLFRHRHEAMSDAQVLFCYALSGGLPREILRRARTLARLNFEAGGAQPMLAVADKVLDVEFRDFLQGSLDQVAAWDGPPRERVRKQLTDLSVLWSRASARRAMVDAWLGKDDTAVEADVNDSRRAELELLRTVELVGCFLHAFRTILLAPVDVEPDGSVKRMRDAAVLARIRREIERNPGAAKEELRRLAATPSAGGGP